MDIIINSLYQNKDIFLREIISNASDVRPPSIRWFLSIMCRRVCRCRADFRLPNRQALDKVRYMSLTNPDALGEGEQRELDIKV